MKCWGSVAVELIVVASSLLALTTPGCGGASAVNRGCDGPRRENNGQPSTASRGQTPAGGKGMAAIKQAADAGKYLFLFFSKADDDQTLAMRKVFQKAMQKVADRAQWIAVNTTDPSEESHRGQVRSGPCPNATGFSDGPQRCHHRRISDEIRGTTTGRGFCHARHGKSYEEPPGRQTRVCVRPKWQDEIQRCRDAGRP